MDLLRREGIGEPRRTQLATMPGITVRVIEDCWKRAAIGPSARGGMKVQAIEQEIDHVLKLRARQDQDRAEVDERRRREWVAIESEARDAIDKLSDDERDALRRQVRRAVVFEGPDGKPYTPDDDAADLVSAMFRYLGLYGVPGDNGSVRSKSPGNLGAVMAGRESSP